MSPKLNISECIYSQPIIKTDLEHFIIASAICKCYFLDTPCHSFNVRPSFFLKSVSAYQLKS